MMRTNGIPYCHCERCGKPLYYGDSAWTLLSSATFCTEECAREMWAELKERARKWLGPETAKAMEAPPFNI